MSSHEWLAIANHLDDLVLTCPSGPELLHQSKRNWGRSGWHRMRASAGSSSARNAFADYCFAPGII
jgi:hypothetical protein